MQKGYTAKKQKECDHRMFKCEKIILQKSRKNMTVECLNAKKFDCKRAERMRLANV